MPTLFTASALMYDREQVVREVLANKRTVLILIMALNIHHQSLSLSRKEIPAVSSCYMSL